MLSYFTQKNKQKKIKKLKLILEKKLKNDEKIKSKEVNF